MDFTTSTVIIGLKTIDTDDGQKALAALPLASVAEFSFIKKYIGPTPVQPVSRILRAF